MHLVASWTYGEELARAVAAHHAYQPTLVCARRSVPTGRTSWWRIAVWPTMPHLVGARCVAPMQRCVATDFVHDHGQRCTMASASASACYRVEHASMRSYGPSGLVTRLPPRPAPAVPQSGSNSPDDQELVQSRCFTSQCSSCRGDAMAHVQIAQNRQPLRVCAAGCSMYVWGRAREAVAAHHAYQPILVCACRSVPPGRTSWWRIAVWPTMPHLAGARCFAPMQRCVAADFVHDHGQRCNMATASECY